MPNIVVLVKQVPDTYSERKALRLGLHVGP